MTNVDHFCFRSLIVRGDPGEPARAASVLTPPAYPFEVSALRATLDGFTPGCDAGAATRIEMRTVFPTKQLRDEAVEMYHAIEGGRQTLSNLAAYVTEIARLGADD